MIEHDDQLALDELEVRDSELEQALERRQRARENAAQARAAAKVHHDEVVRLLREIASFTVDQPIRVGRFRLTKSAVPGRVVSFETEPREQLRIGLVSE